MDEFDNIVDDKIVKPFNTDYIGFLSFVMIASLIGCLVDMCLGVMASTLIVTYNQALGLVVLVATLVLDISAIIGIILFINENKISIFFIFGTSILNLIFFACIGGAAEIDCSVDIGKSLLKICLLLLLFSLEKKSTGLSAWHVLGIKEIEGKTVKEWNHEYNESLKTSEQNADKEENTNFAP